MKNRHFFLLFATMFLSFASSQAQVLPGNSVFPSILENLAFGDSMSIHESPVLSTRSQTLKFEEVYVHDLDGYWCENHIEAADFDKNGLMDLILLVTHTPDTVAPFSWESKLILLQNEGNWTYSEKVLANFNNYGYSLAAGDFNSDTWEDVALKVPGKTRVFLNEQNGDFQVAWVGGSGSYGSLALGDLNEDSDLDLIEGNQNPGIVPASVKSFLNTGSGNNFTQSWESPFYGGENGVIHNLASADLDMDGHLDLVATEIYAGQLLTFSGNGTGTFQEEIFIQYPQSNRVFSLALGNVNGDAKPDVATYVGWGSAIVYATYDVDSLEQVWISPNFSEGASNLALEDFSQDGLSDLFIGTFFSGRLLIFENTGNNNFDLIWEDTLPGRGYTGKVADLDADGLLDLIVGEKGKIRLWQQQIVDATSEQGNSFDNLPSLTVFPNPFFESATISFELLSAQSPRLEIFTLTSERVANIKNNEEYPAGTHSLVWKPEGLGAGTYLCRLTSREGTVSRLLNFLH